MRPSAQVSKKKKKNHEYLQKNPTFSKAKKSLITDSMLHTSLFPGS